MIDYREYYKECVNGELKDLDKFTYQVLPFKFDTKEVYSEIKVDLDKKDRPDNVWAITQDNPRKYVNNLMPILEQLVPYLEDSIYNSYVFVDKVHIYRCVPLEKRFASSLYHYDNFPPTIFKTMIHLTDVIDDNDGPIEFCKDFLVEPSRVGGKKWGPAPNSSRISDQEASKYDKVKIYGEAGTGILFYPNLVHRASLPKGDHYRDVINISTRPTHDKSDRYKYIRGFEAYGSPLMNPKER